MPHRTPQVLYIDDDPGLARLVQKAMVRRGYQFMHASTADEGLAAIRSGLVDVVALDHYLPTGTGLDVLAGMADMEDRPAVVYVTGSEETAIAVAALKSGATDFVPKTLAEEFLELLSAAIDHAMDRVRLNRAKANAEREVREARERAEMLLGEVNHRVANSLAMVAALVGLQANALDDPEAKRALAETQARIQAIAGVHRHLYTSEDVRFVQVADYLGSLMGEIETSMQAEGRTASIHLAVESFPLPTEKVASLGVIVTELVTNALKYAYSGREPGEVRVRMERQEAQIHLLVEDDGIGWSGTGKPQGTGLGSRIVRAMAHSLGANVSYGQGPGTKVSVIFEA
ncbi:histidine kinase dimerization/phosphoacceptor domain -containing protein [Devosia sp. 63-57]|uniref:histidine kinase dimerization/phosphoacceptor domain -containing protein n=1 Tax=Devosia sp. 63-57 TaxID=1895751 RepID=UPI00086EF57C|nr:histidine kinase dimerization/phosphoacceptor domain -containing protein [Devosia sp. 63-57]ODT50620.1 MAG: two-component system sensor histidine kinase/response regulator [Pelagibacterium sp. SCN 63-126]ODU85223.1 MAG: two-component system sensor histidine kinase/response regulator [Pelagibacterium sp. SCN 63-17]OJX45432.1 MAG: two-component system sensor histidine kinase/response regulator [Devosia sp. 63-57]